MNRGPREGHRDVGQGVRGSRVSAGAKLPAGGRGAHARACRPPPRRGCRISSTRSSARMPTPGGNLVLVVCNVGKCMLGKRHASSRMVHADRTISLWQMGHLSDLYDAGQLRADTLRHAEYRARTCSAHAAGMAGQGGSKRSGFAARLSNTEAHAHESRASAGVLSSLRCGIRLGALLLRSWGRLDIILGFKKASSLRKINIR